MFLFGQGRFFIFLTGLTGFIGYYFSFSVSACPPPRPPCKQGPPSSQTGEADGRGGRVASRHVRHRLRLRQCRAGSDEAGGDETENKRNPDYPVNPV